MTISASRSWADQPRYTLAILSRPYVAPRYLHLVRQHWPATASDSGASTQGNDRARFPEAALDFAKCMREHGVDVPDPKPGARGAIMFGGWLGRGSGDHARSATC